MDEYPSIAIAGNGDFAPLNIRLLLAGTSEHRRLGLGSTEPLLEIFDLSSSATVYGQRIALYRWSAFIDGEGALNLNIGEPAWAMTAEARATAVRWARRLIGEDRESQG